LRSTGPGVAPQASSYPQPVQEARQVLKFSTDPELKAKVRDVVGLDLDRPT
jgi:hypothetical protein